MTGIGSITRVTPVSRLRPLWPTHTSPPWPHLSPVALLRAPDGLSPSQSKAAPNEMELRPRYSVEQAAAMGALYLARLREARR
jgi:hypothetical protein